MSPGTVSWRLRRGQWQRLHVGVYATFTGQPDREAMVWAALRRAGADAVLSHQTAAEFSKLTSMPSSLIHVTVPRDHHVRPIAGVIVHRSNRVEQARHPTLTPPRTRIEETTLDLAACSRSLDDALAWLARACGARLTTPDRLRTALESRTRMRWRDDPERRPGRHRRGRAFGTRAPLRQPGRAAAPPAPASAPGPGRPRPAHRVPGRPLHRVRGRSGDGRRGGASAGRSLARPAPRQRSQCRRDRHPALQLGRRDPASLSRRGRGGRSSSVSTAGAASPAPAAPPAPSRTGRDHQRGALWCAMATTMHRADAAGGQPPT